MKMRVGLVGCVLLFVGIIPVAQSGKPQSGKNTQEPCTQAENIQAEEESDTFRSWDALYASYRRYARCENVSAAEGYSESIARILVDHWETLPRLAQLCKQGKGFEDFVRVDETMATDDVVKIENSALHHCPKGVTNLCERLRREAHSVNVEDSRHKL